MVVQRRGGLQDPESFSLVALLFVKFNSIEFREKGNFFLWNVWKI